MFGFSKEIQQKRELILLLDRQEGFVTSTDLQQHLNTITEQTILKYLREVKQLISDSYPKEKLSLHIDKRNGIGLIRNDTNLNDLLEKLYREDVRYEIFRLLILDRSFAIKDFCEEYQISFSTLRRMIKRMNDSLAAYQVSIKAGIKLVSQEKKAKLECSFLCFCSMFIETFEGWIGWTQSLIYN